jgi:7-keto-8-aminopelargonate synthetase-like enzyme
VYPHGDQEALANALDDPRPATIVTDAVFSMDGDVAPLTERDGIAHAWSSTRRTPPA